MKAKLIVKNKEFEIEILDPELQKLLKPQKKTGYERVENNHVFYYECDGEVGSDYDCHGDSELDRAYKCANYYSDETVAENNARADKLMRQLRRFAVEHRIHACNWKDASDKCYIFYNHNTKKLGISSNQYMVTYGTIYFDTISVAQNAIDTFQDELVWYFTKYKDSM